MIYHVFTSYQPTDPETLRRNTVAQLTWKRQSWKELPVADSDLPRLYREQGRQFPYVKDVFDIACNGADDRDIVVYTNADIMVRADACAVLAAALQETHAVYCYRRDFNHKIESPVPDCDFVKGFPYAGKDLFAFRVNWWREVRDHFPDLILGFECWDAVMQELIDLTNQRGKNALNDLICHERHASRWERAENRYTLPGQKMCLNSAFVWMIEHGINPGSHGIKRAL